MPNVYVPPAEDDLMEDGKAMKHIIIEKCSLLNLIVCLNDIVIPLWSNGQSSWLTDPEVPGSIPSAT
jgi:hypothetical protein